MAYPCPYCGLDSFFIIIIWVLPATFQNRNCAHFL